jgi:hypothetical protein
MKVLFIDARSGGDFTMDAVLAGLVLKLGPENVVRWPPQKKHREGIPITTGDKERDYGAERRSLCYTSLNDRLIDYSKNEVNELLKNHEIDYVFVDERLESFQLYLETFARFYKTKIIVIAGHDKFNNERVTPSTLFYMYENLFLSFVDNWRPQYDQLKNVRPMSYAANFDHLWDVENREKYLSEKVYDIFFMGYNSNKSRAKIIDHVARKYSKLNNTLFVECRPDTFDSFVMKRDYFRTMAQSKICINLNGDAECGKALRFYEIPYVGSFMLSQRFAGKQVHPFVDNEHCVYFSDLFELDKCIDIALEDEEEREKIANAGHEHLTRYHTALARVNYMFEELNGQTSVIR